MVFLSSVFWHKVDWLTCFVVSVSMLKWEQKLESKSKWVLTLFKCACVRPKLTTISSTQSCHCLCSLWFALIVQKASNAASRGLMMEVRHWETWLWLPEFYYHCSSMRQTWQFGRVFACFQSVSEQETTCPVSSRLAWEALFREAISQRETQREREFSAGHRSTFSQSGRLKFKGNSGRANNSRKRANWINDETNEHCSTRSVRLIWWLCAHCAMTKTARDGNDENSDVS